MKGTLVVATVCMLLGSAFSASAPTLSLRKPHAFITNVVRHGGDAHRVGVENAEECKLCVEFAGQAVSALLNMILQLETDTCGDLCEALAEKEQSKVLGAVCTILCDIVGIKEFINIIQKEDIDPIYMCELIPVCPVNDHGDAKFTDFEVNPKSGPQGTFDIHFEYVSKNGTGTGMLAIDVDTVDRVPLGDSFLNQNSPPGTYSGDIQLNAQPDPDCDPTQGPCETWQPGQYTVHFAVCNGECGSKHPHSQIYDEATATFTITDSNTSN